MPAQIAFAYDVQDCTHCPFRGPCRPPSENKRKQANTSETQGTWTGLGRPCHKGSTCLSHNVFQRHDASQQDLITSAIAEALGCALTNKANTMNADAMAMSTHQGL